MQFSVYDTSGQVVNSIEVEDDIFAISFNEAVVHQTMVRQLANARLGAADTKTRGEVSGRSFQDTPGRSNDAEKIQNQKGML